MARLTTATVLFTDVEGSTRLWEAHPGPMARAVEQHDALVTAAVGANGGRVVKGLGDGLMATFSSATDAVRAAIDVQRALQREEFPSVGRLAVRIGIHTGEVEIRGDDLFGPAVNRAARLMAVAHGSQVVVSGTTGSMVAGALPDGFEIRDLGRHRLRDLAAPDHIHQVIAPGLPSEFPPLRSVAAESTNLPIQLTAFVGRRAEVAEVVDLARRARLLTITGPGGVGKTRLAIELAAEIALDAPDGVWWVDLASMESVDVIREIAAVLDVTERTDRTLMEDVVAAVGGRRLVVILDNFEHVLDRAPDVARLAAAGPSVRIVVTSRTPLQVPGEISYRLDPLPAESEAVDLFVARASESNPRLAWGEADMRAARTICRRVDGLPLAIELAAARCRHMPPAAVAGQLEERLDFLGGGGSRPEHQRTAVAAVAWSYDLLEPSRREVFDKLAVFAGGFEVEAAERVCGPAAFDAVLDLADASLLQPVDSNPPRFRMLSTVRSFALGHLERRADRPDVEQAHTAWVTELAIESDGALRGKDQEWWHERLAFDMDDFRAVLRRLDGSGDREGMARVAGWLGRLWYQHGHAAEGIEWYERILAQPGPASEGRALSCVWLAAMRSNAGDRSAEVDALVDEAEEMGRAVGASIVLAYAYNIKGIRGLGRGRLDEAAAGFRAAVAQLDEMGAEWVTAPLWNLGTVLLDQGDTEEAVAVARDLHRRATAADDRWGIDSALLLEAEAWFERTDLDRAEKLATRARSGFESIDVKVDILNVCTLMAKVSAERGDVSACDDWAERARETAESAGLLVGALPGMSRAVARLRASVALDEAVRLAAEAAGQPVESLAEQASLALAAAEIGAVTGRVLRGRMLLAAFDRFRLERGLGLTPLRDRQRQRVARLLGNGTGPEPAPTLDEAMTIVASLGETASE